MKCDRDNREEVEVNLNEKGFYLESDVSVIRLDHEMFVPRWSHEEKCHDRHAKSHAA